MKQHRRYTSSILLSSLAAAFLVIGAGCEKEDDAPPPPVTQAPPVVPPIAEPPSDPRAYFAQETYPRLANCAQCHSQGGSSQRPYLATSADTAYDAIKANPALFRPAVDSLLILKGEHTGPALSPEQQTVVVHWLDLELPPEQQPPPDTTSGVANVDQALAEFGRCMDIADWQQSGMSEFPKTQTLDSGPCQGCHMDGLGGTYLNADFQVTFNANRQQPYILKLVEPVISGGVVRLQLARRLLDKGGEQCPNLDQDDFDICHPEFDFGINQQQETRLQSFVGNTLGKLNADGTCPLP